MKKLFLVVLSFLLLAGAALAVGFDRTRLDANERAAKQALGNLIGELEKAKVAHLFKPDSFDFVAYLKALGSEVTNEQVQEAQKKYHDNVAYYNGMLVRADRLLTKESATKANILMVAWANAGLEAKKDGDQLNQRVEFQNMLDSNQTLKGLMKDSDPTSGDSSSPSSFGSIQIGPWQAQSRVAVLTIIQPGSALLGLPT